MNLLISIAIISIISTVSVVSDKEEETNKIQSLCKNSIINSADRLVNNTVRLYRGEYYWELNGLPDKSGYLEGPFKIWYPNMGSIYRNNTVVTLLGGTDRGSTFKTEGKMFWGWTDKGVQWIGGKTGSMHNRFPEGGFEATLYDGNAENPVLVGFRGIKVYYFSTKYRLWSIDGQPSGHIGGKDGENFPSDLSAAFSWPAEDPKDGYVAYLFKRDKFCKRTKWLKSGKQCDEWTDNKVLFGCNADPNPTQTAISTTGHTLTSNDEPQPPSDVAQLPSVDPVDPSSSELEVDLVSKDGEGANEATTTPEVTTSSSVTFTQSLSSIFSAFCFYLILN